MASDAFAWIELVRSEVPSLWIEKLHHSHDLRKILPLLEEYL